MTLNIILIIITAALTIGVIILINGMRNTKRQNTGFKNKVITVKNGVNVRSQRYGGNPGELFDPPGMQDRDTIVENVRRDTPPQRIAFVLLSTGEERHFSFYDQMIIGRQFTEDPMDVRLVLDKDTQVSREHCRIFVKENNMYLEDRGSRNRTYYNGTPIAGPVLLNTGGIITVGNTSLRVILG